MNDAKAWYASKAVWGSVIVLLAGILSLFKVTISPDTQAEAVEWITSAAALLGGLLSLFGRIKAEQKIGTGGTPAAPPVTGETPVPPQSGGWLNLILLGVLGALAMALSGGCGNLDTAADEARLNAVQTPIKTHVEKYPEQAQSWADFVRAWEKSIEARKAAKLPL